MAGEISAGQILVNLLIAGVENEVSLVRHPAWKGKIKGPTYLSGPVPLF